MVVERQRAGVVEPDFFDWPTHFAQQIPAVNPDIVVVTFGGNDAQGLRNVDTTWAVQHAPGSGGDDTDWRAEYGKRVGAVMGAETRAHGGHVAQQIARAARACLADRHQVALANTSASSHAVRVYRAADCYLQNSDIGYGAYDAGTGRTDDGRGWEIHDDPNLGSFGRGLIVGDHLAWPTLPATESPS